MDLGCPFFRIKSSFFSNQTDTVLHISSKLPLKIFFWSLSIGEVSLDLVFEDSNDKKRANFLLQFSFQAAADSFIFNFLLKITDGGTIYSETSMINGSLRP